MKLKQVGGLWFPENDNLFSRLVEAGHEWEPENINAAIVAADGRKLALDIGAHVGLYTRKLAEHFEHVIAIEPVHGEALELNTKEFTNVERLLCAVSDVKESVGFSDVLPNTGTVHVAGNGNVPCIVLDDLNLEPDLIKIDVEGYELKALTGAIETLKKFKPVVLAECNGHCRRYGSTERDLQNYLGGLGYTMVRAISEDLLFVHV